MFVQISKHIAFSDIVVTTPHVTKYSYFLRTLMAHRKLIMLVGPAGSGASYLQLLFTNHWDLGKTLCMNYVSQNLMAKQHFSTIQMNFSAKTTARHVQATIEAKLQKKDHKLGINC